MRSNWRLFLFIGLILLLTSSVIGCAESTTQDDLESKYKTLQIENTILKAELETLKSDLAYVKAAFETLRDDYDTLKAEYDALQANHDVLQASYDALKNKHDALQADYDALEVLYDSVSNELAEAKKSSPPASTPTSILKRGQHLIAQDGTYLGTLDSEFVSESIFNDFGNYGSEFSSTSIWNDFSKYGSAFSSLSAFNDLASKPPMLYDEDRFICYVATNTLKIPRVSPYSLIAFAESMGWK